MTDACDLQRAANLLGAFALAAAERVTGAVVDAAARPGSDIAALVLLTNVLAGASQDTLGRALGLTQPGAVRLVDRLVADGLAERRAGRDRRTKAVVATAAGADAARRALDARHHATTALLDLLNSAEREQLAVLLAKLLAGLTDSRTEALHICRLCDPDDCGHHHGRCPVTRAVDRAGATKNG